MLRIQRVLRPKDIQKASKLFGVDEGTLNRMNELYLLDTDYIRSKLIKSDYDYLIRGVKYLTAEEKGGDYQPPEIMAALKKEYGIKAPELNAILHERRNTSMYFCRRCGIRISKNEFNRTEGLCSQCFADTINF